MKTKKTMPSHKWINVPSNSHVKVIWDKVDNSRLDKGDFKKIRLYRCTYDKRFHKNEKIIRDPRSIKY